MLHVQAAYCEFLQAAKTHQLAIELIERLKEAGYNDYNYAAIYTEFSILFYMKSEYDEAYRYILHFSFINFVVFITNYTIDDDLDGV